jgi:hypothetical protein
MDNTMSLDGHAETAPETSIYDLADDLSDTDNSPEYEDDEPLDSEEETADSDTSETEPDAQEEGEESDDDESGDEPDEPTRVKKYSVPIKAEDGSETTVEVDAPELIKGYQRQADYTRKAQALATRENQAVEFLKTKHSEVQTHYLQQAEAARAAVAQMAGFRTEAELAQLAQDNPAEWVQEVQRHKQISGFLQGLDQQINTERQRAAHEAQQAQLQRAHRQYQETWQALSAEGVDKEALSNVFSTVQKTYGLTEQELSQVYDLRLVKVLRDAAAYQAIKAKRPEVSKKVASAPRIPSKQGSSVNTARDKAMNQKFASGKAKLSDLALVL